MTETTPEFKLTYFDEEGGGEMIRLCFAIGNIPFTDERLSAEEWKVRKPHTPFGGLPLLTIDGKEMAQSEAILRYTGKLTGLYPTDPVSALKVDELVTSILIFTADAIAATRGDPEQCERAQNEFLGDIPEAFGAIERRIHAFGKGPWCVGDSVTIADLVLYTVIAYFKARRLSYVPHDAFDGFERTIASYAATRDLPAVKKWTEDHGSFAIHA